ncbi:MAG: DUF3795 domain-containing protein [Chloroflexi bacterium]|nr:DUF3795 domain-containing protein [Chloroflexota bacterium]
MDESSLVTYCGLYCGLCAERARIPRQASALREAMDKEGYQYWGGDLPDFQEFWRFLEHLCDPDQVCPGCRQSGGPPFCAIRKCVLRRGLEVCAFCEEFPCANVAALAKGYPTLIADGRRMREMGLEAWVREQEQRARTGFAYVDIRCHPYSVPRE